MAEKYWGSQFSVFRRESEEIQNPFFGFSTPSWTTYSMLRLLLRMSTYLEASARKKSNIINVFKRFLPLRISRFQVQLLMGAPFQRFVKLPRFLHKVCT
jgi:hypothetical protein